MTMRSPFYGFFSFTLLGLFLVITGAVGWIPMRGGGVFTAGRWVDGPAWTQMGFGAADAANDLLLNLGRVEP
jgi:hypothetical protein